MICFMLDVGTRMFTFVHWKTEVLLENLVDTLITFIQFMDSEWRQQKFKKCERLLFFLSSDKLVVSSGQDGLINFWDQREKSVSFTLEPYKNANINRPNFGKWIGSASINNEWVATGGGPRLALYHLRNRQPFQIFDFPKEIHVTSFIEDNVLAGGESNILAQYSLTGDTISEIITSGPSILSVAWQLTPNCKILTACGASNKIDVTTNFNYKDTTLNFYGKKF